MGLDTGKVPNFGGPVGAPVWVETTLQLLIVPK